MPRKKLVRSAYIQTFDASPLEVPTKTRKPFKRKDKPLTSVHLAYQQTIRDKEIVLAVSPAGCGKTSLACEVAVELYKSGAIGNIVIARPIAQCDEDIGTLPGDIKEKMDPFVAPVMVILEELLTKPVLEKMVKNGEVEIVPLGVMRGRTFHNSFVIIDEAQNATFGQLKMAMSRIGQFSRMVVNGDVEQCDLRTESPLKRVWRLLATKPYHDQIGFAKMTDKEQLRPEIVNFITSRLRQDPAAR